MTTDIRYTKLSPRPLAQYSIREIRFSGMNAVVRQSEVLRDWQAFRHIGRADQEMRYHATWEAAIRWALEAK